MPSQIVALPNIRTTCKLFHRLANDYANLKYYVKTNVSVPSMKITIFNQFLGHAKGSFTNSIA